MGFLYSYEQDYNLYKKDLEQAIWDDPENALDIKKGHISKHLHHEGYIKDSVTRLLDEGIKGAGIFPEDKEEAMLSIQDAMAYKIDDIVNWQQKSGKDFDKREDYLYYSTTVYISPYEPVGKGFAIEGDKFTEREAHSVTILLKRDYESNYGFHLQTAYPNVIDEYAEPTGKYITKQDIIENRLYDFKSDLEKAAFMNLGESGGKITYFENKDHEPEIKISNKDYIAYIKEYNDPKIIRKGDDGKYFKSTFEKLKTADIQMAGLVNKVVNTYRDIEKQKERLDLFATPLEKLLEEAEKISKMRNSDRSKEDGRNKDPRSER